MRSNRFALLVAAVVGCAPLTLAAPAVATPVCTDGYKGGPPLAACGGRIFPEAAVARGYVQFLPDPAGFEEYRHGIEFLAKTYPRWISVTRLSKHFDTRLAKSVGEDGLRSYEQGDDDDGYEIWVVKITDHKVPDRTKMPLFFSMSVHGNERGGLEGGLRTAEDLAMAAENGGTIVDGIDNYESTTGRKPKFHEYEVADVLKEEIVYLVDFNPDGWAVGDFWADPPVPYTRGNGVGTDLNRQMPTVGRINSSRNPLTESEMIYGHKFMHEVADTAPGGLMAHAADVHGELTSNAYVDIMYPAGQYDSVDHRRLMAIAERTKSVIDETLYAGIVNEAENAEGGDSGEGSDPSGSVPTKPAHWATVWDTLGYTDTGFIGDYMATDLAVTGMDYEFFLNHTVPDKSWNTYMQENHINGSRALIKTAMAYSLWQEKEFNASNVVVDPGGRAGYVFNPDVVTDTDKDGPGTLPGPTQKGVGADGERIKQHHYRATNMKWFKDTSRLMPKPFVKLDAADVAARSRSFTSLDTLVLADVALPSKKVDAKKYYGALSDWVKDGGNLVLTDRALHALGKMKVVAPGAVQDVTVYQPYTDIQDFDHPMVQGLRPNARQLVEAAVLGYCIGNICSPMTVVDEAAVTDAGGHVIGTTGEGRVSVAEIGTGKGTIRIVGGALPTPSEADDHRYGLRDYAMTYTGLYIMENSLSPCCVSKSAGDGSALGPV
jgi:hypothetical protein